jgi:hypothetical protein
VTSDHGRGGNWDGAVDSRCPVRRRIPDGCAARIEVPGVHFIKKGSTAGANC